MDPVLNQSCPPMLSAWLSPNLRKLPVLQKSFPSPLPSQTFHVPDHAWKSGLNNELVGNFQNPTKAPQDPTIGRLSKECCGCQPLTRAARQRLGVGLEHRVYNTSKSLQWLVLVGKRRNPK